MKRKNIPIFPLTLVIFPSSRYPLHIFEERYKKMIAKCLREKTGFGIIAQIKKELSKVGSYVEITEVLKKYETGEMDIIVKARKRFITLDVSMHPDGYYEAEIEEYDDIVSDIDHNLLLELKDKFEEVIDKFNFQLDEGFWRNYYDTKLKSFKLAEKAGLTLEQQQVLLSYQNENKRMNYLINHFDELETKLSEKAAIQTLVMSDGYLNN